MKTTYLICFIVISMMLSACCGHQTTIKKMQAKIDSLETICGSMTGTDGSYKAEIDKIYERLELIRINQEIIDGNFTSDEDELTTDKRAIIQESINTIQRLMDENRRAIDSLNLQIKNSPVQFDSNNSQLESWLADLNDKVSIKDKEVTQLQEQLAKIRIKAQIQSQIRDSLNMVSTLQDKE